MRTFFSGSMVLFVDRLNDFTYALRFLVNHKEQSRCFLIIKSSQQINGGLGSSKRWHSNEQSKYCFFSSLICANPAFSISADQYARVWPNISDHIELRYDFHRQATLTCNSLIACLWTTYTSWGHKPTSNSTTSQIFEIIPHLDVQDGPCKHLGSGMEWWSVTYTQTEPMQ